MTEKKHSEKPLITAYSIEKWADVKKVAVEIIQRHSELTDPQLIQVASEIFVLKQAMDFAGDLIAVAENFVSSAKTEIAAEDSRKRSAKIDAEMARRREEDRQEKMTRKLSVSRVLDIASWWNLLSKKHKEIVLRRLSVIANPIAKRQEYKLWFATKCYRDGLLPGAMPPPEKLKKAGEP